MLPIDVENKIDEYFIVVEKTQNLLFNYVNNKKK